MKDLAVDVITYLTNRIDRGNYTLPSIPEAHLRLINLLSNPDSKTEELEKTIGLDPILTGQILKIANSCISGALTDVTSLKNAIMRLGRKHVRSLVMMISIKTSIIQGKAFLGPMQNIWEHSVACAFFGRILAKKIREDAEEFFTIGLLHNIGKLIILSLLYEMLQQIQKELDPELLQKIYDAHHLEIAKKLLTTWKISPRAIQIIGLQNCDTSTIKNACASEKDRYAGIALILNSRLCAMVKNNSIEEEKLQPFLKFLELPGSSLSEMVAQIKNILVEVMAFV